jgi:triosephosphate isomerase
LIIFLNAPHLAASACCKQVHAGIRSWFKSKYSAAAADAIRITYGGSVTPETVNKLCVSALSTLQKGLFFSTFILKYTPFLD